MNHIKHQIYQEISSFLENYKMRNTKLLSEQFDITGALLDEIDEAFYFVMKKNGNDATSSI